jgi:type IV pilus assembly protein PilC
MKAELPFATRFLIGTSDFVMKAGWWIPVGVLVLAVGVFLLLKRPFARRMMHRISWYTPVMQRIIRAGQYAFYFQSMHLMYGAGVVLSRTLPVVNEGVTNTYFLRSIASVGDRLREGRTLRDVYGETKMFDPLAVRMVGVGEQTGTLETQLAKLSDHYMKEVNAQVEQIGKLVEPLILIFVGVFFALLIIALVGPLYDLVSNVGGKALW